MLGGYFSLAHSRRCSMHKASVRLARDTVPLHADEASAEVCERANRQKIGKKYSSKFDRDCVYLYVVGPQITAAYSPSELLLQLNGENDAQDGEHNHNNHQQAAHLLLCFRLQ